MTVLCPGPVHTNMTTKAKVSAGTSCVWVTAQKCVYKTLIDLGRETFTYGAMSHDIIGYLCSVIL